VPQTLESVTATDTAKRYPFFSLGTLQNLAALCHTLWAYLGVPKNFGALGHALVLRSVGGHLETRPFPTWISVTTLVVYVKCY